jgi:hypothetical protein
MPATCTGAPAEQFKKAVMQFHERGGGLLVWGDNDPYFGHANVVLPELLKTKVELIGNTPGGKPLSVGKPTEKGHFGPNIITTGVIKLFEGITICYPNTLGPLKVLATSSDGHPAVCYADNESLQNEKCGRIIVDCGWTKMYCSWKEAGTARYVTNATIWLLALEHKLEGETLAAPLAEEVKEGKQTMEDKHNESKEEETKEEKIKDTLNEQTEKMDEREEQTPQKPGLMSKLKFWSN